MSLYWVGRDEYGKRTVVGLGVLHGSVYILSFNTPGEKFSVYRDE